MGVVWTFFLSSIFSLFFLPLWETARYRLKNCLKGPLNPKQPTNQPTFKARNSDPPLLQAQQVRGNFRCTNGEMENGYCSQHGLSFPNICGQRTITNKGDYWSLFFGREYREKIVQHILPAIPHLCTEKLSRTCCAISPLPHTTSPFKSP